MNKEQRDVHDFHVALDIPVETRPAIPADHIIRLRMRLITEEFGELLAAMGGGGKVLTTRIVAFLQGYVGDIMDESTDQNMVPDIIALADAIADLKYVLEGTNLAFGIDGEYVWDAVHATNMRKAGGPVDDHGKRLKPPGWTLPDIEGVLRLQGWKEK